MSFHDFGAAAKTAHEYGIRAGQTEALMRWVHLSYGDGRDDAFYENVVMMIEIELQLLEEPNPFVE
ncbi:MAG: hypothetical protein ABS76_26660 [Pelagibacterium sp. SCN 64-44]|nr:MAG: hypothetical protein ABS76_26660 [Pelagibacterium sp. SCN 64-44]